MRLEFQSFRFPEARHRQLRQLTPLLLTLLLGCGGSSGPEPPEFIDVTITAVGTVTWKDGSPIVGAIFSSPLAFGYSAEQQTTTGIHGSYTLAYRARCTPEGLVFSVNVRLPPQMANHGGSCTGVSPRALSSSSPPSAHHRPDPLPHPPRSARLRPRDRLCRAGRRPIPPRRASRPLAPPNHRAHRQRLPSDRAHHLPGRELFPRDRPQRLALHAPIHRVTRPCLADRLPDPPHRDHHRLARADQPAESHHRFR